MQQTSLISYPTKFPIKVMGRVRDDFAATICALVKTYDATFDEAEMSQRLSSKGRYISLTLNVYVTSQMQLDAIYCALTAHPMVQFVL